MAYAEKSIQQAYSLAVRSYGVYSDGLGGQAYSSHKGTPYAERHTASYGVHSYDVYTGPI